MPTKRELEAWCGDLTQLFGIQECTLQGGKATGTRAYLLNNGSGLELTVLTDKCFAIPQLRFKGVNIGFITKTGICGPQFFTEEGTRGFLRNFEAGFLTTCGLSYVGTPSEENGQKNGLHGVISNTPIENASSGVTWEGDTAVLTLSGRAREGYLFGPNLELHKTLRLNTAENRLVLHDTVENKGFAAAPLMILYHFNYGYPMLDENVRIYTNYDHVVPRDERSAPYADGICSFGRPRTDTEEVVVFRTMSDRTFTDGRTLVYNPKLGIAVQMHLDAHQLPVLNQWKSECAGDYALGLEPGTGHVGGLTGTRRDGLLMTIAPGETKHFDITVDFLDDRQEIEACIAAIAR